MPSLSLFTLRTNDELIDLRVTSALTIAAPLGSMTTPLIAALVLWHHAGAKEAGNTSSTAITNKRQVVRNILRVIGDEAVNERRTTGT